MDIYTTHKIPFEIGTWARGHKFDITAVRLSRSLMKIERLHKELAALENQIDAADQELADDVKIARNKMEKQDAA